MATHTPAHHILNNDWPDQDRGIRTPTRSRGGAPQGLAPVQPNASLVCGPTGLRLRPRPATLLASTSEYLDLTDPPGYQPNTIPRDAFNENLLLISAEPMMPQIQVRCLVCNFDPTSRPIHWRLECHYVICRHTNRGGYRYAGAAQAVGRQWQGRSFTQNFTLFAPSSDPSLLYDYGSPLAVCGGHAVLCVALREPSAPGGLLLDYAHLRIVGTNRRARTSSHIRNRCCRDATLTWSAWSGPSGGTRPPSGSSTTPRSARTG